MRFGIGSARDVALTSVVLVSVASASCSHPAQYARTWFVHAADCNESETTVTPREDVPASHFFLPPPYDPLNPDRSAGERRRQDSACDVFEVSGCGRKALVCCAKSYPEGESPLVQCFPEPGSSCTGEGQCPVRDPG